MLLKSYFIISTIIKHYQWFNKIFWFLIPTSYITSNKITIKAINIFTSIVIHMCVIISIVTINIKSERAEFANTI